ncbi:TetR family transcriptional regulator [Sphingomonas sp. PP-F2F-A104-K0414]|uniref:TetR/AcrR family transcriptional regulator n=1 Tax=Sphingomonas sp. PP-F2F-A104-K0414 TaxID=2135661 RepID=UPI00104A52F3|nr:TetR/AcrR family transcriptional regulator [Sphingomonas sp. PP-F2F-A104-K0414]TCP96374.1 TetR family transcriptional regulator [Sphingomonas sp. PP-F2F-A104-K0414]
MNADETGKAIRSQGGHPTAERAAEIGAAVIGATMQAFAQDGTDFSMDQVAVLAGVSKQAIYRRWKSKTALLIDSIDGAQVVGLVEPGIDDDDPVSALRSVAWHLMDTDVITSHRVNIFLQAEGLRHEPIQQRLMSWRNRFLELYVRHLNGIERANQRIDGDMAVQAEILMELMLGGLSMLAVTGAVSSEEKLKAFEDRWRLFSLMALKPR